MVGFYLSIFGGKSRTKKRDLARANNSSSLCSQRPKVQDGDSLMASNLGGAGEAETLCKICEGQITIVVDSHDMMPSPWESKTELRCFRRSLVEKGIVATTGA